MIYDYDLIIIGGGMSGYTLAKDSASIGMKVLLVEKHMIGGSGLFYGGVPFSSLIRASQQIDRCTKGEKYGLGSMRHTLDWKPIASRVADVQQKVFDKYEARHLRDIGCDVVFATGSFVDQYHINLVFNEEMNAQQPVGMDLSVKSLKVSGKKIIIATGSTPVIPEIEGLDEAKFIVPQQIYELSYLPASIGIIGDDIRRIEIAQVFARFGARVTIFISGHKLCPEEDDSINESIERIMELAGVTLIKNAQVQKVRKSPTGNKQIVYYSSGVAHSTDVAEIVVVSGSTPNVENLNLEAVNIEATENGITVNSKLQTTNKRIFALGDVNGEYASDPHKALHEAEYLFRTQCLHLSMKRDYRVQGSFLFLDPEVVRIGYKESDLRAQKIKYDKVEMPLRENERSMADNVEEGMICVFVSKKQKILGVQIISPRAGELIREWQVLLQNGGRITDIAQSPSFLATYGSISHALAKRYVYDFVFTKKRKKFLSLIFGYRGD